MQGVGCAEDREGRGKSKSAEGDQGNDTREMTWPVWAEVDQGNDTREMTGPVWRKSEKQFVLQFCKSVRMNMVEHP